MKKYKCLLVVFALIVSFNIGVAQTSSDNISFLIEGECYKVLEEIHLELQNDSLAVNYFLENYSVSNSLKRKIMKKDYDYVLKLLTQEEYKTIRCKRKGVDNYPLLQEEQK